MAVFVTLCVVLGSGLAFDVQLKADIMDVCGSGVGRSTFLTSCLFWLEPPVVQSVYEKWNRPSPIQADTALPDRTFRQPET